MLADSVDDYVRQQMKEKHIPGAVLIVREDGKTVSQKAYGVANVELNVPMRVDDVFLVASITKVFVATAAFLLVEDGKLHLDDKITQIIPELPSAWSEITVLHCLSHTSGIPDIVRYRPAGFEWLAGTEEEALKLLSPMPLEHKPGEKSVAVDWNRRGTREGLWIVSLQPYFETLVQPQMMPFGWSPDGKQVYAVRETGREIVTISVASPNDVVSIAVLPSDLAKGGWALPSLSPDGRQIIANLAEEKSDVWLMENFDPSLRATRPQQ